MISFHLRSWFSKLFDKVLNYSTLGIFSGLVLQKMLYRNKTKNVEGTSKCFTDPELLHQDLSDDLSTTLVRKFHYLRAPWVPPKFQTRNSLNPFYHSSFLTQRLTLSNLVTQRILHRNFISIRPEQVPKV